MDGSAAFFNLHIKFNWDDTMEKNEPAHEMYQVFEKYKRNCNDKECGTGA